MFIVFGLLISLHPPNTIQGQELSTLKSGGYTLFAVAKGFAPRRRTLRTLFFDTTDWIPSRWQCSTVKYA